MHALKLIIGNKKYSSWSLRPWLVMKYFGIPFEEELSLFDHATNHAHFATFSPSKKVPVLIDRDPPEGPLTVWDSLAIVEYLAERFSAKPLWPEHSTARARARAAASEMHSGFTALRTECPMNMARDPGQLKITDACRTDIHRIEKLFSDCYEQYGGPYLFGDFSIADAMFAPVVNRIRIYQLTEHDTVLRYCEAIEALPSWQQWQQDGIAEPWVVEQVEL